VRVYTGNDDIVYSPLLALSTLFAGGKKDDRKLCPLPFLYVLETRREVRGVGTGSMQQMGEEGKNSLILVQGWLGDVECGL